MKDLETMQREGRDGFRQDFTSDCEGHIDCIKGQLDKLDQHTANTWEAAQESMKKSILESGLLEERDAGEAPGDNAVGSEQRTFGANGVKKAVKEFISNMDNKTGDN